jgi:AraC-like DNA-binding protein
VNVGGHLCLKRTVLPASTEWDEAPACWRFLSIAKGDGYWVSASQRQAVESGQMIVLPPAASGVLRASQIGPATLYHFQLCASWLSGLLTLSERQWFDSVATHSNAAVIFEASHPLAKRFIALTKDTSAVTSLLSRCRFLELAAEALAGQVSKPEQGEHSIFACERFQQLVSQQTEQEILETPIDRLADFCNCSPRYFRTLFRKRFKISLTASQARLRLLNAAQRLQETKIGVEQLARQCGYQHPRSFAIAFRREFGCTPTEWRHGQGNGSPEKNPVAGRC